MKAYDQISPEVSELIFLSWRLEQMAAFVDPDREEVVVYDFEHIAQAVEEAEDLLTSRKNAKQTEGLCWDDFQVPEEEDASQGVTTVTGAP